MCTFLQRVQKLTREERLFVLFIERRTAWETTLFFPFSPRTLCILLSCTRYRLLSLLHERRCCSFIEHLSIFKVTWEHVYNLTNSLVSYVLLLPNNDLIFILCTVLQLSIVQFLTQSLEKISIFNNNWIAAIVSIEKKSEGKCFYNFQKWPIGQKLKINSVTINSIRKTE